MRMMLTNLDSMMIKKVRVLLEKSVNNHPAESILFSGGLDTAILAGINKTARLVTVGFESYSEDYAYAQKIAQCDDRNLHLKTVTVDEALSAIPLVIKILQSFDPALPNDLAVYFGLLEMQNLKVRSTMTGDGADELFAGYSYMKNISPLDEYIAYMATKMSFSSNMLCDHFGITLSQSFIAEEVKEYALTIPTSLKIREEDGVEHGKWILRKAFEDMYPRECIWQSKRPCEYGSGMTKLCDIITSFITNDDFEKKQKEYNVKFYNKEHLYYYEIYKEVVGEVPQPKENEVPCNGCGAGVETQASHCRVCGWVGNKYA